RRSARASAAMPTTRLVPRTTVARTPGAASRRAGRLEAVDRRTGREILAQDGLDGPVVEDLELARLEVEARAGLGVRRDAGRAGREDSDHGSEPPLHARGLARRDHHLRPRCGERQDGDEAAQLIVVDAGGYAVPLARRSRGRLT